MLWNADGLPDGKAEKYWLKAEKIIDHQDKLAADEAWRAARASRERSSTFTRASHGGMRLCSPKAGQRPSYVDQGRTDATRALRPDEPM